MTQLFQLNCTTLLILFWQLNCSADLLWAVPTNNEVHVCVALDGTSTLLIFSKGGTFLQKKQFEHILVDVG